MVSTHGFTGAFFLTPLVLAFLDLRGVFRVRDKVGLADIVATLEVSGNKDMVYTVGVSITLYSNCGVNCK